jgi:hypothetical protein
MMLWWIIGLVSVLWVSGFIASLYHVESSTILGYVLLFFLWPYIAWSMMRQMG